jgi:hypothetical protein
MSMRDIIKVLRPQKLEPRFKADLLRLLRPMSSQQGDNQAKRVVRSNVFKAFLGGKFISVKDMGLKIDYGVGDFDLTVIQQLRQKYEYDLLKILTDYRSAKDERAKTINRLAALAAAATWESYNKGKLSSFRQRAEGKIGLIDQERLKIAAIAQKQRLCERMDPDFKPAQYLVADLSRIYWVPTGDEKVCEICSQWEAISIARNGWSIWEWNIPSIPYDSHPFCRCEYETIETQ